MAWIDYVYMRKLFLLPFLLFLLSCDKETVNSELDIPSSYDGANFEANAAAELALLQHLQDISNEMKKGRTGEKVNESITTEKFNSLKSITTPYFSNLIENNLLPTLISASGGQQMVMGETDGVYGAYLFTKFGIENEQLIEKGLFAAAFYQQARTLANNPDETTPDRIVALFGAHPDFAGSNNANLHNNPDRFIANYAARRDKNDGSGFYSKIQNGLIKLQAAVKAGNTYDKQQQEAIEQIFQNWEKGSAATAVNYIYEVLAKLSATNPDDATIASALHSYSEVLGFIHGFRTVEGKIITDAEIDEILMLLNVPVGQTPTTLNFLSSPATELPKVLQVLDKIQSIYGFTDTEMEEFKRNWVSEQNR